MHRAVAIPALMKPFLGKPDAPPLSHLTVSLDTGDKLYRKRAISHPRVLELTYIEQSKVHTSKQQKEIRVELSCSVFVSRSDD